MNSCGYFAVDTYLTAAVRQSCESFDIQMYVHHILSIASLLSSIYFMNIIPVFCAVLLWIESSTIFIGFRWFFYQHSLDKTWYAKVNTLVGGFAFLFSRLIFQVFMSLAYGIPALIRQNEQATMVEQMILGLLVSTLLISILVNLYWLHLIIKQVARSLTRSHQKSKEESRT